jgi:hypothetical protein
MIDFLKAWATPDNIATVLILLIAILTAATASFVALRLISRFTGAIPASHKIALIGLPGSGKTTLITAMFEMIQRGVHVQRAHLHGMQTITRVNKYIAALNSQQKIGPSREKDIFVFRFSYLKRRLMFSRLFDVEIADFPGEYSERIQEREIPDRAIHRRYHERYYVPSVDDPPTNEADYSEPAPKVDSEANSEIEFEYTLFNKEFFSWIGSSREFVFLVDLSVIYSAVDVRKEVADITARMRTSWQVIEDAISDRGIGSPKWRPVHLVFTKADSALIPYTKDGNLAELLNNKQGSHRGDEKADDNDANQEIKTAIKQSGATSNLIKDLEVPEQMLATLTLDNGKIFSDLISFFRNRENDFSVHYTGMKMLDSSGERYGVRGVLVACLP